MKRTNVRKTLENKNTCLYNKTMNIEIKNSKDFYNAIYSEGETITITLIRNNEELILEGPLND